jgi:hypothetical protein
MTDRERKSHNLDGIEVPENLSDGKQERIERPAKSEALFEPYVRPSHLQDPKPFDVYPHIDYPEDTDKLSVALKRSERNVRGMLDFSKSVEFAIKTSDRDFAEFAEVFSKENSDNGVSNSYATGTFSHDKIGNKVSFVGSKNRKIVCTVPDPVESGSLAQFDAVVEFYAGDKKMLTADVSPGNASVRFDSDPGTPERVKEEAQAERIMGSIINPLLEDMNNAKMAVYKEMYDPLKDDPNSQPSVKLYKEMYDPLKTDPNDYPSVQLGRR